MAKATCYLDDGNGPCGLPLMAKGLCNKHYARYMTRRRRGLSHEEALAPKPAWQPTTCAADGCDRRAEARGLCQLHWARIHGRQLAFCIEPGCDLKPNGPHYTAGYCVRHASSRICLGCCKPVAKGYAGQEQTWCDECNVCMVTECGRRRYGRQMICSMHVRRLNRHGSLDAPDRRRVCSVAICDRKHYGGGYCHRHWKRRWHLTPEGKASRDASRARRDAVYSEPYDRMAVLDRCQWTCGLCRRPIDRLLEWPDAMSKSIDHILPLSKGGHDIDTNVQAAHLVCNVSKGNRENASNAVLTA